MDEPIEGLIEQFYEQLKEITEGEQFRKAIKRPEVVSKDRKTFVNNFKDVCESVGRDQIHFSTFIATELKISTSISEHGVLVINSTEKRNKIEELVKKYVTKFVQCKMCKSCDTGIEREKKITFINCKKCRAKSAIEMD